MRRRRRTASDWQEVLAAFNTSELNPVDYCHANQIGIKSFYRARAKHGSRGSSESGSGFVKVKTVAHRPRAAIELVLPQGRIYMDSSVSPRWVADLLKTLGA
jgi:hypothetical protein